MSGWMILVLVVVVLLVLASLGGKSTEEPVAVPEAPKGPSGAGIEKRLVRQIVQTPDGGELVVSETVKLSGVDEQGLLVDQEDQRYATLGCEHLCRNGREGYGGRCRACGTTHCTSPECSVNCVRCGAPLAVRAGVLEKE